MRVQICQIQFSRFQAYKFNDPLGEIPLARFTARKKQGSVTMEADPRLVIADRPETSAVHDSLRERYFVRHVLDTSNSATICLVDCDGAVLAAAVTISYCQGRTGALAVGILVSG